ncbi:4Fe-4S binding protein [bacterium]|nr:4Fe-4S binding protein [bacterium]
MPWIDKNDCTGCGICIEECPVDCIAMEENVAEIDMKGCIRCALCHDICPVDAVKHDSEKEEYWIEENVNWAKYSIDASAKYYGREEERLNCLNRMIGHFKREKRIAEATVERLLKIKEEIE